MAAVSATAATTASMSAPVTNANPSPLSVDIKHVKPPESPVIMPSPSPAVVPPPLSLTLQELAEFQNFSLDRSNSTDSATTAHNPSISHSSHDSLADAAARHGADTGHGHNSHDLPPHAGKPDAMLHSEWHTLDVSHRASVSLLRKASPEHLPIDLGFSAKVETFYKRKLWGSVYTVFVVRVSCAGLQWEVIKRYSEFRQLHSQISDLPLPKELKKRLPKLPPRQLIGKEDDKFITTRMQLLDVYLAQLLALPDVATSAPLLSFLGALQNKTEEEKDIPDVKATLYLDAALPLMDAGDVLLFRTAGIMSSMQRSVTSSCYDHVGIVCRIPPNSKHPSSLVVLEATSDGVKKYPLRGRLMAWDLSDAQVVWRHLKIERTPEFQAQLRDFVADMDGKQYGLNPINMIRRVSVQEKDSFFCSEIVAMALKKVGALPDDKPSNAYLPVTFSASSKLQMKGNASLDQEVLLQFHKLEVESAQLATDM